MSLYRDYSYRDANLSVQHHKKWCLVLLKIEQKLPKSVPFSLFVHHQDSHNFESSSYLVSSPFLPISWRIALIYIPEHSDYLRIYPIAKTFNSFIKHASTVKIIPLNRFSTTLFFFLNNPSVIIKTVFKPSSHFLKRLRLALLQSQQKMAPHLTYQTWYNLYDQWQEHEKKQLLQSSYRSSWPSIYFHDQYNTIVTNKESSQWINFSSSSTFPSYIILKEDKEILRPHSLSVFADQAARYHFPAALYGDSDEINSDNQRHKPCFKTQLDLPLLLTGFLTQDPWIIRQDVFEAFQKQYPQKFSSIYAHRLALALYMWSKDFPVYHIPFILSHKTIPPNHHDKQAILNVIEEFKKQQKWNLNIQSDHFPFTITFTEANAPVSIIIPTTINSKKIQSCLLKILSNTDYKNLEIILIISQNSDLTPQQKKFLMPLQAYKNLRIILYKTSSFNFAQSCNYAISYANYSFIALINDDIEPLHSSWLIKMMGYMQIEKVGAVGAKLYYPNQEIQHAGIIMGAANLCEHAGRFQNSKQFFLNYDHEVSAITGACMLIRREAYDKINGFDEYYQIAYNDIDFCLRLSEASYHLVQCQQAHLIHHESLSLGNHYKGVRAGKEREEILSLRQNYQYICDNDPFYNPNLSLQRGMDYQLAFPPRISIPFGLADE